MITISWIENEKYNGSLGLILKASVIDEKGLLNVWGKIIDIDFLEIFVENQKKSDYQGPGIHTSVTEMMRL